MNPLLFADWRRINLMFTAACWLAVVALVCVCSAPRHAHHAHRPAPRTLVVR